LGREGEEDKESNKNKIIEYLQADGEITAMVGSRG